MFATHDTAKLQSFFLAPGTNQWSYVHLALNHFWLHITYKVNHGKDGIFTETLMSSNIIQLVELSKQANVEVIFVDIVSPYYMNGTDRWKMEALREIWLCAHSQYPDQKGHVFQLENGNCYEDMLPTPIENDFFEDKLIFSLNSIKYPPPIPNQC
jgi:hypothetical protein